MGKEPIEYLDEEAIRELAKRPRKVGRPRNPNKEVKVVVDKKNGNGNGNKKPKGFRSTDAKVHEETIDSPGLTSVVPVDEEGVDGNFDEIVRTVRQGDFGANNPDLHDDVVMPYEVQHNNSQGAKFLFEQENISMKTELTAPLTVVMTQAIRLAEDWGITELEDAVIELSSLRVSLDRKGRREGVDMLRAELSNQMAQFPQGMPPGSAPPGVVPEIGNKNVADASQKKGFMDRLKER